ncbi:MAG TPA: MobF family relaxase [Conexibacter sp.]|nr:MobF family relaxase [Conexibacter sp.]
MTAASIPAASTVGIADYLDGKTVAPEAGDYYLGRDGMPAEAPGRWVGDPDALARVGITPGWVESGELRAMMEGRRPDSPREAPTWLRNAGPDGERAGGLDVTFSAPKGVSVAWALGDDRAGIEAAHEASVDAALGYLRESVELTVRYDPATGTVPDAAAHLHAAAFTHTTARGVGAAVPDPQLHTHVVITSVERADGSTAAVRSRPAFRCGARGRRLLPRAPRARDARARLRDRAGRQRRPLLLGQRDRGEGRAGILEAHRRGHARHARVPRQIRPRP